jgi:uncharacterized protein YecE (DUF72 family)
VTRLRIGCSGWNYGDWQFLYTGVPQRAWLERYAELFDTVEVNTTFYRLPLRSSVERWVEQTPPSFLFSVKASRYLTHIKRLTEVRPGLERLHDRIEPLIGSAKLGPVLWQLPASFRRDDERLASALGHLRHGRHCVEFRHPSWFTAGVYELLRSHRIALVIGDHPQRPFQTHELTADWTFIRFHYGGRGRKGNYSRRELEEWARRIELWRNEVEVFGYFNNDWTGFAVRNALWLKNRLGMP